MPPKPPPAVPKIADRPVAAKYKVYSSRAVRHVPDDVLDRDLIRVQKEFEKNQPAEPEERVMAPGTSVVIRASANPELNGREGVIDHAIDESLAKFCVVLNATPDSAPLKCAVDVSEIAFVTADEKKLFGVPLQYLHNKHGWLVPPFVKTLCEWIEANALHAKGAWRVHLFDEAAIDTYQAKLDAGNGLELPPCDIGARVGLLYRWLKLLPDGLFHTEQQVRHLMAAESDVDVCWAVVNSMAAANKATLQCLVQHWRTMTDAAGDNAMHPSAIATVIYGVLTNYKAIGISEEEQLYMLNPVLTIIERNDVVFADQRASAWRRPTEQEVEEVAEELEKVHETLGDKVTLLDYVQNDEDPGRGGFRFRLGKRTVEVTMRKEPLENMRKSLSLSHSSLGLSLSDSFRKRQRPPRSTIN